VELTHFNPSFAVLPLRLQPEQFLRAWFANFDSQTVFFQNVLTMTTASVIYHMEWLKTNLEFDHPLFSIDLFRIVAERLFSEMVEYRNWKPGDVLRATGVPPHVHILLNTTELLEHQKIPDLVSAKVAEALKERNQLFRNASKDDVRQFITDAVRNTLGGGCARSRTITLQKLVILNYI